MKSKTTKFNLIGDVNTPIALNIGIVTMTGTKVSVKMVPAAKKSFDTSRNPKKFLTVVRQMAKILGHNGKRQQVSVVGYTGRVITLSIR